MVWWVLSNHAVFDFCPFYISMTKVTDGVMQSHRVSALLMDSEQHYLKHSLLRSPSYVVTNNCCFVF